MPACPSSSRPLVQAFSACQLWTTPSSSSSRSLPSSSIHPINHHIISYHSFMASSSSSSYSFFTNHHHYNNIIINLYNNIITKISNPFFSSSSNSTFIIPPPPPTSRSPSSPSVCWWWCCWRSSSSSPSSIPSSSSSSLLLVLFFVSTILTSLLSFSAASSNTVVPTSPRTSTISSSLHPSPSPIYFSSSSSSPHRFRSPIITTTTNNKKDDHTTHHSSRLLILTLIITSVALFLIITCVSLMACFNFMVKRRSKRVEDNHDQESAGLFIINNNKTHPFFPDRPISSLDDDDNNMELLCNTKKKIVFDNPCFSAAGPKRFSWDEIQRLTMNFTSRVIGEGGFSTVYLSHFSDSSLGALKIHSNSERLNRIFKQELDVLLQVRHDNIVKFLGYCDEKEEGALVFEYVSNGNLHEKLHENINGGGGGVPLVLPWKRRMSIAFQLAQAIEYLHEKSTHQIIHGDIKSSNVLLDDQFNCKLCDFGFSKMGFSSTVMPSSMSPLMGSPGYMDPNYLRTGIASKKNDVYSFGVIILELITGIEAFCSEKEKLLTSIAAPVLKDSNSVAEMVDPRLGNEFDLEEAMSMASISALCLKQQPGTRPSMAEILRMMTEKISSSLSTLETQRINSTSPLPPHPPPPPPTVVNVMMR